MASQWHYTGIIAFLGQHCSTVPTMLPSPSVLTRPNLWSAIVQESMKVCAMTRSTASTLSDVCTSKTNWGFLMMLIQNRRGRLQRRQKHNRVSAKVAAMVLKDILHITASPSFALPAKPAFHTMHCCLALPFCSSSAGKGGCHFASDQL